MVPSEERVTSIVDVEDDEKLDRAKQGTGFRPNTRSGLACPLATIDPSG